LTPVFDERNGELANEEITEVPVDATAADVTYEEVPSEVDPRLGATSVFKLAIANYIGTQGRLISLHSGDPGLTGATEIPATNGYTKQLTTWGAAVVVSGGANDGRAQITGSTLTFSVPGGVGINYYGVWSGASAAAPGNFLYGKPLQPGATLTSAGQITLTPTHAYGLL
jgi:hypothetical protein